MPTQLRSPEDTPPAAAATVAEAGVARYDSAHTALVLVGFQNVFFSPVGALHGEIEGVGVSETALGRAVALLTALAASDVLIIEAPLGFAPGYPELGTPVGVLAAVKDNRAFQAGTFGSRTVDAFIPFRSRLVTFEGRRGFSAFTNTQLHDALAAKGITDVVVAGALACLCVDSTARGAHERGYRVTVLSDCTVGRSKMEHDLFCRRIYPLYADVVTSAQLIARLDHAMFPL
ncbi:MAG TPA: cysteine hydrolase [Acidimicrobiales bacterium]|nr:cysteine hydrolase [Acidimicrobiales bacterium]